MSYQLPGDDEIRTMLREVKTVAVVGISKDPARPSHGVASYLLQAGYEVIPVNPTLTEWEGLPVYPDLRSIPADRRVDVVDVFRRSEETPPVAEAAVAIGAKVLWLQEGVTHAEAAERAGNAGLQVVMDRCIKKEHARLLP